MLKFAKMIDNIVPLEREREREDRYDGRLLTSGLNWKEKMERKEAWKAYWGN